MKAHPTGAKRVSELDGLRGIAILLVLLFHFTPTSGALRPLAHVMQTGWIGVDLFFVLSGYLITGILLDTVGRPHYYRNFIVRRSLRIFPLYYACLLLYGWLTFTPSPVEWKVFLKAHDAGWYVLYLGNVWAFVKNAWPGAAILTPLWSLQVEEQFYWSFPFIVWAVSRRTLGRILAASVAVALGLRTLLVILAPENGIGTYVLTPCRMDALAMGGLVAVAARERPEWLKKPWIGRATLICGVVFAAVCLMFGESALASPAPVMRTLGYTSIDLFFTGVLILVLHGRPAMLVRVCRQQWLVWVGTISYGLYLLHIPALVAMDKSIAPAMGVVPRGTVAFFVSFPVAIGAASVSWVAFESRVLRLKDRLTVSQK